MPEIINQEADKLHQAVKDFLLKGITQEEIIK